MASSSFTATSSIAPKLFGRAGYNGPNRDEEDDNNDAFITIGAPLVNSGRGDDDDDDDDQGRAGYN